MWPTSSLKLLSICVYDKETEEKVSEYLMSSVNKDGGRVYLSDLEAMIAE